MDYEKYKNALEKARLRYNEIKNTNCNEEKFLLELFPELKESEDERIRKGIIELVKQSSEILDKQNQNNMIAWLKRQKATDKEIVFRPLACTDIIAAARQALEKIEIGKEVILAFNGAYIPVNGKTVAEICNEYFSWTEKQGEKKVPFVDFKAKDWYASKVDGKIHDMTYDAADKVEPKNMENETEIPFDANDSELTEVTYDIPKGFHAEIDDDKVVIKIGEKKPIMNVPTREVILAIWDLGNEWKKLTNGNISTKYGTQLDYIQKHWHESEYYLREKQNEKKSKKETKTTAYNTFDECDAVEYVYILDYNSGRVIVAEHIVEESISELFEQLGLKENQCHYMVSDNILSIEYINF